MNIKAYTIGVQTALYGGICKNKADARRYILNHGMASLVDYIIFKNKKYSIGQVYKWKG